MGQREREREREKERECGDKVRSKILNYNIQIKSIGSAGRQDGLV